MTDHNEPSLDSAADQQTLDSLQKELNVLRNLSGNAVFFTADNVNSAFLLILHIVFQENKLANTKAFPFSSLSYRFLCLFSWIFPGVTLKMLCVDANHTRDSVL